MEYMMDIKTLIGNKLSFTDNEGTMHICTIIDAYYKNNKINLKLKKDDNEINHEKNEYKNN